MHTTTDTTRHDDVTRLDVASAAAILGIKPDSVRKRVARGLLRADHIDGKLYVYLPDAGQPGHDTPGEPSRTGQRDHDTTRHDQEPDSGTRHDTTDSGSPLVTALQSEIAYLREALAREQAIVAHLSQRLAELPFPAALPAPPSSDVNGTISPAPPTVDQVTDGHVRSPEAPSRPPWWRRLFLRA